MGWREDLATKDAAFNAAEEPSSLPTLPDGQHNVTVTSSRVLQSSWNEYQWVLELANEEGRIVKYLSLENEKTLGWTKRDAKFLGWEGTGLIDLAVWAPVAEGAAVGITVKRTPKDSDPEKFWLNVYLNTLLKPGTGERKEPDFASAYSPQDDDGIPF